MSPMYGVGRQLRRRGTSGYARDRKSLLEGVSALHQLRNCFGALPPAVCLSLTLSAAGLRLNPKYIPGRAQIQGGRSFFVVYRVRQPDPDPYGSRTGSRYDWLISGTPTGLRAPSPVSVKNEKWRLCLSDIIWRSVFLFWN